MKWISATMAENKKIAENVNIATEQDAKSTKPRGRSHIILAATVFGVLAIAGIVVAAVYVGHVMTQSSYQEARVFYREDDGTMVQEKVQIAEEEVDFEAEGRFTVVYDFKNKLVIIRPLGNRVGNKCYMTNLTSDMGTMEEIKQRIHTAEKTGVFASNVDQAANFVAIDKTAEIPSTSTKAKKMCSGIPVQWIERNGPTNRVDETRYTVYRKGDYYQNYNYYGRLLLYIYGSESGNYTRNTVTNMIAYLSALNVNVSLV